MCCKMFYNKTRQDLFNFSEELREYQSMEDSESMKWESLKVNMHN